MKCSVCNGRGYFPVSNIAAKVCTQCNGTGEIERTNEEWIHQCNTEQLAEKLTDFSFWLVPTIPTEDKREQIRKKIELWLKEKHNGV